jgi:hypothetical protein
MVAPTIGIIANPASGRDVRRFVSHSTVFDNHEKSAIVHRALLGLEAVGITHVDYMPEDDFGIVARAVDALQRANPLLDGRCQQQGRRCAMMNGHSVWNSYFVAEQFVGIDPRVGSQGDVCKGVEAFHAPTSVQQQRM